MKQCVYVQLFLYSRSSVLKLHSQVEVSFVSPHLWVFLDLEEAIKP